MKSLSLWRKGSKQTNTSHAQSRNLLDLSENYDTISKLEDESHIILFENVSCIFEMMTSNKHSPATVT